MTETPYIASLSTGVLALIALLIRFNRSRSYRDIALFFTLSAVWGLVYLYCGVTESVRAFAASMPGMFVRLILSAGSLVSVAYFVNAIAQRKYTRSAFIASAIAAGILAAAGTLSILLGSLGAYELILSFSIGFAGLAAAGFAVPKAAGMVRRASIDADSLLMSVLSILALLAIAFNLASRANASLRALESLSFEAIFGLGGLAVLAISLALSHEKAREEPAKEGSGDAAQAAQAGASILSNREMEIAKLLLTGKSYREIGEELFIAPSTVKTHVLRIYEKAGVKNKMQLANKLSKPE
jgi:DNA-binding CsgD family transcriptional regulator